MCFENKEKLKPWFYLLNREYLREAPEAYAIQLEMMSAKSSKGINPQCLMFN